MIFNQKGNITFYGMLILTFMSYILIHFIYVQQKNYLIIKDRAKVFLCHKSFINHTEKFIKQTEILNMAIKVQALGNPELKKMLQLKQVFGLVSYLKNLKLLQHKKCSFDPMIYKTPYELLLLDFKRSLTGETVLRNTKWQQKTFGKTFTLSTQFHLKRKFPLALIREVSESLIKKEMPFLN